MEKQDKGRCGRRWGSRKRGDKDGDGEAERAKIKYENGKQRMEKGRRGNDEGKGKKG
jgi:hypothetical protein